MANYEFDAPSHVMDFNNPPLDADVADRWFDTEASNLATTPNRSGFPFGTSLKLDLPRAVVPPQVNEPCDLKLDLPRAVVPPQVKEPCDSAPNGSSSPAPNIVTSWGNRAPTGLAAGSHAASHMAVQQQSTSAQFPVQARRVLKRKSSEPDMVSYKKLSSQPAMRRSDSDPTPRRGKCPVRRRSTSRSSQQKSGFARRSLAAAPVRPKGSEDQELEHIRRLQMKVAEHRKKNEASYKAALSGSHLPKRMALSTTVPKEFHFSTDCRVKAGNTSDSQNKVDFVSLLRKHPSSPAKAPKRTTVPKAFNLSQGNKRKGEEPALYVSMARQVQPFSLLDRFHLRSRQREEREKAEQVKMTQPHSPRLIHQRIRQTTVKSSAELEAEEMDEISKSKFKALLLNRNILDRVMNSKKPAVKEPTIPEGFDLHIEKRIHERQATKKTEEEEHHVFHAQPLPSKILEGVVGVPPKKLLLVTIPESPDFALPKRMQLEHKVEVKAPSPIKAKPMLSLPVYTRPSDKSEVEVCPFSFEEREKEKRTLKEKKLEDLRNEEVQQFKAQLLPDFHEVHLPKKTVLEPTKPEPFKLQIDERGVAKNYLWEKLVKEEQKRQVEATVFKAQPSKVVHKEPFLPKKESHSVLVPEAVELATERRARERQEFERELSEKETLRTFMGERQRQEQEEREKEELSKIRQDQVHKARPVRRYKPVPKKSDLPRTVPQSPHFSDRFRSDKVLHAKNKIQPN